jgi:hypothetical protein
VQSIDLGFDLRGDNDSGGTKWSDKKRTSAKIFTDCELAFRTSIEPRVESVDAENVSSGEGFGAAPKTCGTHAKASPETNQNARNFMGVS